MKSECELEGRIEIVGEICTIYPRRGSAPIVSRVLGSVGEGESRLTYLDRMVHERHHSKVCGLNCSGAVSTILHGEPHTIVSTS